MFTKDEILAIIIKTINDYQRWYEMIASTEKMSNFTFKMDDKTRKDYSELCSSFGLSMSAATLALVRQAVRSQSMSFSMRDENGFTPAEASELRRRIAEIEKGNVVSHDMIEG